MKKSQLFVLLFISLFLVSFVNAVDFITSDIDGYSYKSFGERWIKTKFMKSVSYTDNNNATFNVITFSSEDSEEIDALFYDRITNSNETVKIGKYTLYVFGDGKYVFWRNGNSLIQIHALENKAHEYPIALVEEYLDLNPPTCTGENCYESIEIIEETPYTFDEPPDIYWLVKQHLGGWYDCPENNSVTQVENKINELKYIKDRISSSEIQTIKQNCDDQKSFHIDGTNQTTLEIKQCLDHLNDLIEPLDLSPNKRWLYRECYVRSYFDQRFNEETLKDYNPTSFEKLYEERDQEFVDFIKLKYNDGYSGLREVTVESEEIEDIEENKSESKENDDKEISTETIDRNQIPDSIISNIKLRIKSFLEWFG